ncbi:MAG: indole-3-glycerol-phosphate synthase TrpC, partial [Xanthomonadales bacterium]|nr:indole-3-glycerol-phosphate synthase TrpC [Xanthomonadales bacterium]
MSDILQKILARKAEEVAQRKAATSVETLRAQAELATAPRGFAGALRQRIAAGHAAVIAEVK